MTILKVSHKTWGLSKEFNISRGSKTEAKTIEVSFLNNNKIGIGECVPYLRYNETILSVSEQIESLRAKIESGKIHKSNLSSYIGPGAARNALDCAFWDLSCKIENKDIWSITNQAKPMRIPSCYTVVLDEVEKMICDAEKHSHFPLLKLKVNKENLESTLTGIRKVSPNSSIILDANESFDFQTLKENMGLFLSLKIDLIEQPLSANDDDELIHFKSPIPICADESFHSLDDFDQTIKKYASINIKLDKTGGLTEALKIKKKAQEHNIIIMIGCMVSTSLSMLPALTMCNDVNFVDLDGPVFLKEDVKNGLVYKDGQIEIKDKNCWG